MDIDWEKIGKFATDNKELIGFGVTLFIAAVGWFFGGFKWLIDRFTRRDPAPATNQTENNTTNTRDHSATQSGEGNVIHHITYAQTVEHHEYHVHQGISEETIRELLNEVKPVAKILPEEEILCQQSESEKRLKEMEVLHQPSRLDIEALTATLKRIEKEDTAESDALLKSLREKKDAKVLVSYLKDERDRSRLQAVQIQEKTTELNRELATWAYKTGEIPVAQEALEAILEVDPNDLDALNRMGHIFDLLGELNKAEAAYTEVLKLCKGNKIWQARAYGNLGTVYETRGELRQAEEYYLKSLKLEEELGNKEGMASDYGNLGTLYQKLEELDKAEKYHRESLKLEKEIGHKEGMAMDHASLGNLYQTRGELKVAEEHYQESLELVMELGHKEGIARVHGFLGSLYQTRQEFSLAEAHFQKALLFNQQLGHKEGMAGDYSNLGALSKDKGDLQTAVENWEKSVTLYEEIGMPHMVEKTRALIHGLDAE